MLQNRTDYLLPTGDLVLVDGLPATAIKFTNGARRQREVVGGSHESPALVGLEPKALQHIGFACLGLERRQRDCLTADKICGAI